MNCIFSGQKWFAGTLLQQSDDLLQGFIHLLHLPEVGIVDLGIDPPDIDGFIVSGFQAGLLLELFGGKWFKQVHGRSGVL